MGSHRLARKVQELEDATYQLGLEEGTCCMWAQPLSRRICVGKPFLPSASIEIRPIQE